MPPKKAEKKGNDHMCGLFGLIRSPEARDPSRASRILLELGRLAQERGRDAAGLAWAATPDWPETTALKTVMAKREVTVGGWRVLKGTTPFHGVWRGRLRPELDEAAVVIGHTRWATQGAADKVINASPLLVGHLVGTHNGDISAMAARHEFGLWRQVGDTDTEVLLQALDGTGGVVGDMVHVLESVKGRAALAWADHRWPGMVMLARAALSPLALARDLDGNLFWASNPDWFARAAVRARTTIPRSRVWLAPEGTLLCVDVTEGPCLADLVRFTPTARPGDERIPFAVWRGFTKSDRAADEELLNHRLSAESRPFPRGWTVA